MAVYMSPDVSQNMSEYKMNPPIFTPREIDDISNILPEYNRSRMDNFAIRQQGSAFLSANFENSGFSSKSKPAL
jgi:hypothetical protein